MEHFSRIETIKTEVQNFVIQDKESLEAFRLAYVSGKSKIADLLAEIKNIPQENRKNYGAAVNALKELAQQKFKEHQQKIEEMLAQQVQAPQIDLTLPAVPNALGSMHPLSITKNRIIEIFERLGFNVSESYEIEDDFHNFTALNFPPNHPAREMQDTFFIEKGENDILLRTHTSTVQVRLMETQKPPIRSIMPGRVFRNEAISARAHCIFHQVEGLFIDENVSFADLKQTLYHFAKEMFGKDTQIRFRPSFFPFTEPSAEIDISCLICKGKGCNVCKHTGWVEIGGAGMVDPNVLESCKIDSQKYTGFAFGMGIERIAMLKYGIKDLRLFTENDLRFLQQFRHL
ncbi:MAG: phenylalanine--tRNA ligase subunit alpha [Microscillaceae bacterium]|nr:phenylalanine--tRNA ligase subunit alpha [Microscillaceae bacterium]MDW8461029.1 phenylalanine--tRNA ligase subunit alpha [Cytophagales bacterium]